MSVGTLSGHRILVVEDEWLIADYLATMLEDMECKVVGPVSTVADALARVAAGEIDCALLDANLNGESSESVADALTTNSVPFIVVTGYGALDLATDTMNSALRLSKPLAEADLRSSLELALAQTSG